MNVGWGSAGHRAPLLAERGAAATCLLVLLMSACTAVGSGGGPSDSPVPVTNAVAAGASSGDMAATAATPKPGRLVRDTVISKALAGNLLGQSASREVIVYLPGGYDADVGDPLRRDAYPSLYLFHRYDGRAEDWSSGLYQGFKIQEVMDSLVAWEEMPPAIVIMPDASGETFGSPYLNSAFTGNWEDFLAEELVDHVDTRYRTLKEPSERGVAGHSAGGYAALKAAMKRADVFGSVYAMSPCCLALMEEVEELGGLGTLLGTVLGMNGDDEGCAGSGPASQVPIKAVRLCLDNLLSLEGIAIDVGDEDGFESTVPWAERFSDALDDAGVEHTFEVYTGTHTDHIGERLLYQVMPFFAKALAQKQPVGDLSRSRAPGS